MNLTCLLPATCIGVTMWACHPCDGKLYLEAAWCYGPQGRIGYWLDVAAMPPRGLTVYAA